MKKKLLFTAFNLDVGGVEKCLVDLVNNLDKTKYDITVYLQVKEGIFLNDLKDHVIVKGYNLSYINNKKINNKFIKMIVNIYKYIKIIIKSFHKYDVSICYAPGYIPSSILALTASKNRIAWMHTNILTFMENYKPYKNLNLTTKEKAKRFLKRTYFRKYNRKIFVSKDALNAYLSIYPQDSDTSYYIYNLIDYKRIVNLSSEKLKIKHNKYTFLNVGRHTEFDKRLSRIISAAEKLKEKKYDFIIYFVGDGQDTKKYETVVKKKNLTRYIKFLGKKSNPYPYFKISDVFVMSSKFEGLPTTLMESLVLKLPVITTDVSDAKELIDKKYGVVVDNDDESIFFAMENAIKEGIKTKVFNPVKYNDEIIKKIEGVFND